VRKRSETVIEWDPTQFHKSLPTKASQPAGIGLLSAVALAGLSHGLLSAAKL